MYPLLAVAVAVGLGAVVGGIMTRQAPAVVFGLTVLLCVLVVDLLDWAVHPTKPDPADVAERLLRDLYADEPAKKK